MTRSGGQLKAGFSRHSVLEENWVIKRNDLQAWIEAGRPNHRRSLTHHTADEGEESTGDNQ